MDIVVGVSDMRVSNATQSVLVTYSLGSCIGIVIYDELAGVGGLLHFMLPESSLAQAKAQKHPFMFANTGIPLLFREAYKLGARKQRMRVIVVGGAQTLDQKGFFNIGKKNFTAVKQIFLENNIRIDFHEIGGTFNRTIKLFVKNGKVLLRTSGTGERAV